MADAHELCLFYSDSQYKKRHNSMADAHELCLFYSDSQYKNRHNSSSLTNALELCLF